MTFTEWINTQEDICSKLREQGYEEKNDIRKFFNDRIRCILNTRDIPLKNLSPKRSYERIFQINRDNERKWFFPELFKEDDEEEKAANYYFNKSAADLSLAQAAFLAGINRAPNAYNPYGEEDNTEAEEKEKN